MTTVTPEWWTEVMYQAGFSVLCLPPSSHLQRIRVALHEVRILPRPAVHLKAEREHFVWYRHFRNKAKYSKWALQLSANLDLGTEAVEESLSCAVAVFTDSEGMSRERPKYLQSHSIEGWKDYSVGTNHKLPVTATIWEFVIPGNMKLLQTAHAFTTVYFLIAPQGVAKVKHFINHTVL